MAKQRWTWRGTPWVLVVAIPAVILGAFTASQEPNPANLCGAPANPLGYTYCGGSRIREPSQDTCRYFHCVPNWDNGTGYLEECGDGMVSRTGGRRDSCSAHGGDAHPVYSGTSG